MFFRLSFVTLLLALLALGTPVKRDATQVESDIKTLTTKSETLDASIKAFPNSGATIEQAMAIHQDATDLVSTTRAATNDVEASAKFTDTETTTIFESLNNLFLMVKTVCNDLEAKKAAVVSVNAQGIAEADLKTMKETVDTFGTQLMLKVPADMQSSGRDMFKEADIVLEDAIAAYA